MTHENCKQLYSDWKVSVHCSFNNVFSSNVGEIVGTNIHRILKINHFKTNEMIKENSLAYNFTCTREEANSIRDNLNEITTDLYSYIWFSIQTNPFHFLGNRRSMINDIPIHLKEYPVYYYFGSMYSYNIINIYSEKHPSIQNISITRWKDEPESLRIISKDKSKQIFIPIKWIQKQILVNIKERPCVVFMLKYSVKMKKRFIKDGQTKYERLCKIGDNNDLETIISKSSDIILSFDDIDHTYTFLNDLIRETSDYRNKFQINFVTLKQIFKDSEPPQFNLPSSYSHKENYSFKMLYSMGYIFQDKYSKKIHEEFLKFNKELFNDLCYYLKEKLEENHCYKLKRIFSDFDKYIKEKHVESLSENKFIKYSIGCLSITPLRIIYQKMESTIGNRALRMKQFGGEDMFLLVHIRDEDNKSLKDFDSLIKRRLKSKMFYGIKTMGKTYRLFGTSTSQLKEMSFWFVDFQDKPIEEAWKILGDFQSITNVAKYISRIGLYFSTSYQTNISFTFIQNNKFTKDMKFVVTMIDDVEIKDKENNYCFTDGIGQLSWGIAGLIAKNLNIPLESKYDIPSAYQVRIAGCKGMLAIDPQSTLNDYYIKVRPTMEKFKSDNWDLEICDYSKPLELKFNNQVIMLMSDLGNSDAIFESYQNASINNYVAEQNQNEQNRKLKYSLAQDDLLKNKIPLPINEARNMFGIVDETQTLEYGQVFIQYKNLDPSSNKSYIVVQGDVIIAKMPCLHPGDIRKFKAIDVPQLRSSIRDCIVFPIKGKRPHPNEMSGSDLDGDQYWVYWGELLKIKEMDDPLSYESSLPIKLPNITNDIIIDHIIESFGAGSQGIICDVHLAIADSHKDRTRSQECKYLAELFARAVDAPKTGEIIDLKKVYQLRAEHCRGYPYFMKKYDQPLRESNSILNKLFLKARRRVFQLRDPLSRPSSSMQLRARPILANGKHREQKKTETNSEDKEFQEWISLLDNHQSTHVIKKSNINRKSRTSIDFNDKPLPVKSPEPTKEPKRKATPKKKEEQEEESQPTEASARKGKKVSDDTKTSESVEPKEIKAKTKSTATAGASSTIPKPTLSHTEEILVNRNIVFNGMTTVANRLKWNQSNDGRFTADLDGKTNSENNATDKVIQFMIESTKVESFSKETKLTLIISWGELYFKFPQTIQDTKPKNIKELIEIIKTNNNLNLSFDENDINQIVNNHEPSNKSLAEYVLLCKSFDDSSSDNIALIFNDKKKLKKISIFSTWWICGVRGSEKFMDSLYKINCQNNEIDSKHPSFAFYLNSIFKDLNATDLLSGTSPKLSIDKELLKSNVYIISLQRLIRCEYTNLYRQKFDSLTNIDYDFYHVTYISTENINGKIQTNESIEFHVKQIQIAKKYEKDLKQLFISTENFFN